MKKNPSKPEMYQNTRPLVPVRVAPPRPPATSFSNTSRTFNAGAQPQLPKLPPEREAFILDTSQNQNKPKTRKTCSHRIELYIVPPVVAIAVIFFLALIFYQFFYKTTITNDLLDNSTTTTTEAQPILSELGQRRALVRRMAREAWRAYAQHALGADALKPLTQEPYTDFFGPAGGLGVVSALSTLHILGLKEEYEVARNWTERKLNFSAITKAVDVQHSVNYFIGGLLSAYALTGDEMFLNQSKVIADVLDPAYRSPTGLSYWKLKPSIGEPSLKTPFLSTVGGQHLEYKYLTFLTGNASYLQRATTIRNYLTFSSTSTSKLTHPYGLYMHQVDVERGVFTTAQATLFTASRAFFANLLLSYVQSGGRDMAAITTYVTAFDAIYLNGLFKESATPISGFLYLRNYNLNTNFHKYDKYMNVDGCAWGGLLALGAQVMPNGRKFDEAKIRHRKWAEELTDTCSKMANKTATRLAPYRFYFDYRDEEEVNMVDSGRFVLSPELASTYFLLYRLTKDKLYQDLAWTLAQSIYAHCRTPSLSGYTRIRDVDETPTEKGNFQDVDFLAATLKYLYLTFLEEGEEDELTSSTTNFFNLDDWVFNERGQPLPVCGRNAAFSDKICS